MVPARPCVSGIEGRLLLRCSEGVLGCAKNVGISIAPLAAV